MTRQPRMARYTKKDFDSQFPTDAACLEWLCRYLYPDGIFCETCGTVTKHHRVKSRPSYSCDHCGHHVHPTAGTIFHKSTTPLTTWFYAIYLMASTRCGISAKQIERETGVTYKTAWRMFKQIRSMLQPGDDPLGGPEGPRVEMDESVFGGRRRGQNIQGRSAHGKGNKTLVVGIVERKGRVMAMVADDTTRETLHGIAQERILPETTVYTDDYSAYWGLTAKGYHHRRINHSAKIYVMGDVHTQTIEGFWSLVKRGIGGVYHAVSRKYLQTYLDEYSFRYNHRSDARPMFTSFLNQIEKRPACLPASAQTQTVLA